MRFEVLMAVLLKIQLFWDVRTVSIPYQLTWCYIPGDWDL